MSQSAEERILALPPLREVIAASRLSARKALAQNFLLDLNLTRKIARAAGPVNHGTTIEIGPGPGGLTRALLLEGAEQVIAVERDARAVGALDQLTEASSGRLTVIEGDALKLAVSALREHAQASGSEPSLQHRYAFDHRLAAEPPRLRKHHRYGAKRSRFKTLCQRQRT